MGQITNGKGNRPYMYLASQSRCTSTPCAPCSSSAAQSTRESTTSLSTPTSLEPLQPRPPPPPRAGAGGTATGAATRAATGAAAAAAVAADADADALDADADAATQMLPLPAGWVAGVDGLGRTYYYNSYFNISQWEHPGLKSFSPCST